MKKTYYKAFNQIRDFLKTGSLKSEPKTLYFIDSCAKSLLNSAKSISKDKNIPLPTVRACHPAAVAALRGYQTQFLIRLIQLSMTI